MAPALCFAVPLELTLSAIKQLEEHQQYCFELDANSLQFIQQCATTIKQTTAKKKKKNAD